MGGALDPCLATPGSRRLIVGRQGLSGLCRRPPEAVAPAVNVPSLSLASSLLQSFYRTSASTFV